MFYNVHLELKAADFETVHRTRSRNDNRHVINGHYPGHPRPPRGGGGKRLGECPVRAVFASLWTLFHCTCSHGLAAPLPTRPPADESGCCLLLLGNLHFANVLRSDAKGGATYTCVAENRVMRSIERGEYNTIAPHGGNLCNVRFG